MQYGFIPLDFIYKETYEKLCALKLDGLEHLKPADISHWL